jgi:hypothetical protein
MKQKFLIPVVRIGYGFKTIEVEAESQEEAEELALDEAGDHEYSEKESQYEIEDSPRPKSSGELTAINKDYRSLVLNSYQSTLNRLIKAYVSVENETETDGYIDLKRRIHHKSLDANLSEDIDSFHTNGTMVSIRCDGDNSDESVTNLSNEQLIEIIAEMEYYITHPDEIDIY